MAKLFGRLPLGRATSGDRTGFLNGSPLEPGHPNLGHAWSGGIGAVAPMAAEHGMSWTLPWGTRSDGAHIA